MVDDENHENSEGYAVPGDDVAEMVVAQADGTIGGDREMAAILHADEIDHDGDDLAEFRGIGHLRNIAAEPEVLLGLIRRAEIAAVGIDADEAIDGGVTFHGSLGTCAGFLLRGGHPAAIDEQDAAIFEREGGDDSVAELVAPVTGGEVEFSGTKPGAAEVHFAELECIEFGFIGR